MCGADVIGPRLMPLRGLSPDWITWTKRLGKIHEWLAPRATFIHLHASTGMKAPNFLVGGWLKYAAQWHALCDSPPPLQGFWWRPILLWWQSSVLFRPARPAALGLASTPPPPPQQPIYPSQITEMLAKPCMWENLRRWPGIEKPQDPRHIIHFLIRHHKRSPTAVANPQSISYK